MTKWVSSQNNSKNRLNDKLVEVKLSKFTQIDTYNNKINQKGNHQSIQLQLVIINNKLIENYPESSHHFSSYLGAYVSVYIRTKAQL